MTDAVESRLLSPENAVRQVEMAAALARLGIVRSAVEAGRLQPYMTHDLGAYAHTDVGDIWTSCHFSVVPQEEGAPDIWVGFSSGSQAYELEAVADEPVLHVGRQMRYSQHRGLHSPQFPNRWADWSRGSYGAESVAASGQLMPHFVWATQRAFKFAAKYL